MTEFTSPAIIGHFLFLCFEDVPLSNDGGGNDLHFFAIILDK